MSAAAIEAREARKAWSDVEMSEKLQPQRFGTLCGVDHMIMSGIVVFSLSEPEHRDDNFEFVQSREEDGEKK
jgi:hypothetical protein